MKRRKGESTIHIDTAAAVSAATLRHGNALGLTEVADRRVSTDALSGIAGSLKFFVGELSGLFFILLSTMYIFAVPAALSRAGEFRDLMRRTVKRVVDFMAAVVGLALTAPFFVLLPVLIKLDSRGPVFYSQVRVGVNRRRAGRRYHQRVGAEERRCRERRRMDVYGKPFRVIKFRTMVVNAESRSGPVWATKNDPRVTRLGAILRKTRLDEIPQFINILLGDMSLVGPRPERPCFVKDLSGKVDNYTRRLEVKPGLTGLAQIENGYDSSVSSVADKVGFDLQYIRNWSVLTDLRIILRTVIVVMTGKGAC